MERTSQIPSLPLTRWRIPELLYDAQNRLAQELRIHPVLSRILVSRALDDVDEARRFLTPTLKDLHNPFLIRDMKRGLDRVIHAVYHQEKIAIFGDYDVDGITALVTLYKFLSGAGADVVYYIPDRIKDGYGLNRAAVDRMSQGGTRLLITVDCGVSNPDEIAYAKSLGLDTIVLDHHEIPDRLPEAVALINTNRDDCPFPFKQLSGVGIVFNFLIALRGALRETGFWRDKPYPNLMEYLDMVALGTIGDVSPLIDENRIFARIGLDLVNKNKRIGIQALREMGGAGEQSVDSTSASFSLIPRINAAGRVSSAEDAVRLLLTDDLNEAQSIARKLDAYNRSRQAIEKSILNDALAKIDQTSGFEKTGAIVMASADWHPGVIGIVASKLVDIYYRPTILISLKDGIGKGSGRSIPEFNLHRGLSLCRSFLLAHGGHRYAAGLSIKEESIDPFRQQLNHVMASEFIPSELFPHIDIDAFCSLEDLSFDLMNQLEWLAPFGHSNPEPLLFVRNVSVSSPAIVGNNHLKMRVSNGSLSFGSIWFGKGQYLRSLSDHKLDIVFTPQLNTWNGTTSIQLKVKDIAVTS